MVIGGCLGVCLLKGKRTLKSFTINKNREVRGGDTRHDEIDPVFGKFKPAEDTVNKTLFHPIDGFFEINFESHEAILALGGGYGVYGLLH